MQPSLETVQQAFVAPQTTHVLRALLPEWRGSIYDGGVYRPDGSLVEEARHNASSYENVPGAVALTAARTMPGTYLYGGVLRNHFGHFLVESIGRLWGLDHADADLKGIVFNPYYGRFPGTEHPNETYEEKTFIKEFFELLNINAPRIFPAGIWQFEKLIVPGQLMMNTAYEGLGGHPVLREFLSKRLKSSLGPIPDNPRQSIYVSRGNVAATLNIFLQEEVIENNLRKNGYEIIYPETLNLRDQLDVYRNSCRIIFAEGSAGHLIALAANPKQRIGMIRRQLPTKNGSHAEGKFELQIRAFGCREAHTFKCISRMLNGAALGQPTVFPNALVGILDFEKLGSELAAQGFIDPGLWSVPGSIETELATKNAIAEFHRLATVRTDLLERRRNVASKPD